MNERRRERLASLLEDALPEFFRDECEMPTGAVVSILYVEIIESGSRANIFVSVWPDEARGGVAKELKMSENKATHFVRGRLGSKHAPQVRFLVR